MIPDIASLASLRSAQLGFDREVEVDDVNLADWSLNNDDHSKKAYDNLCFLGINRIPHGKI